MSERAAPRAPTQDAADSPWPSAAVAAAALALYLVLAPPVSGEGDSGEFTLALATGGLAHPSGYPLYTIAGHLFCRALHAFSVSWEYAANAWSALGAALAIFFLHRLALKLARRAAPAAPGWSHDLAALVPVVLFGLDPIWTNEATLAEVNAWHVAWALGAVTLFVAEIERLDRGGGDLRADRRAAVTWGLVCGLGLAHHLTSVLVSAPLSLALLVALARARRLRPGLALAAVAAMLVPLAADGYVAWRAFHPGLTQWPGIGPSWGDVFDTLAGSRYHHYLGYFAPAEEHRALLMRAALPLLLPGLILLAVGVARAGGAVARTGVAGVLGATLAVCLFGLRYGVPDVAPYFLPAIALSALALAPALAAALEAAAAAARPLGAALGLAVIVALGAVLAPWLRAAQSSRADLLAFERTMRSIWASLPPGPALVFWADDRHSRLLEYQVLRHEKPALIVVDPDLLADDYPRARFTARFGVDPLADLVLPRLTPGQPGEREAIQVLIRQMVRNINARVALPVIFIDFSRPEVRLLDKPRPAPPAR
jgi:hypothetical protein